MTQHETIIRLLLVGLSGIISFGFVFYGVNIIYAQTAPQWLEVFAYVTVGYGLGSIALLSMGWSSRAAWTVAASKLLGLCYLGVFTFNALRTGFQGGVQVAGLLIIAVVLWCNWYALTKVVERP